MQRGLDCAWQKPNWHAAKAAGYDFVVGYISKDSTKDLTAAHVREANAAGLTAVLAFETTATRAHTGGFAGGAADARFARAQQAARGIHDRPIPFAVDEDISALAARDYFRGVKSVLGKAHTGVYGSFRVCLGLRAMGLVGFTWQAYAWSGGRWITSANLRQVSNDRVVAGASVDLDEALTADFGQWPAPAKVAWAGFPTIRPGRKGDRWTLLLRRLLWSQDRAYNGVRTSPGDNKRYGYRTAEIQHDIRAFQHNWHLSVDGVIGPHTWAALHRGADRKRVKRGWIAVRRFLK